jgi:hypothetical protein
MPGDEFLQPFTTAFALLGLKLLFGQKQVTIGSVILLACISAATAQAWTGGGGAWVEVNVAHFLNQTLQPGGVYGFPGAGAAQGMLRTLLCQVGAIPKDLAGGCAPGEVEIENL